jgi:hypothetical protein
MSRSIAIWYRIDGEDVDIETGNRDLLGTQSISEEFWSLPVLKKLGIERLSDLGHTDPVWFYGWEGLEELEREITLLEQHEKEIVFHPKNKVTTIYSDTWEAKVQTDVAYYQELKLRWIGNLRYCLDKLKQESPKNSIPEFMIG